MEDSNISMRRFELLVKRAFYWKDETALDELEKEGIFLSLEDASKIMGINWKHLEHHPGDCWQCDRGCFGIWTTMKIRIQKLFGRFDKDTFI